MPLTINRVWALVLAATVIVLPGQVARAGGDEFAAFVGVWAGHGRALEIGSDGGVLITYRTYQVCGRDPPPCDTLTENEISDGGRITVQLESGSPTTVIGRIASSADPNYPEGTPTVFTLDANDAVTVQIGDTRFANFCGETAPVGYCGA
jgi:hypothetical protein